jgi:hypothetical protein
MRKSVSQGGQEQQEGEEVEDVGGGGLIEE